MKARYRDRCIEVVNQRTWNKLRVIYAVRMRGGLTYQGCYLIPGMIDDQVHFREPGLTHKGSIATESYVPLSPAVLISYMEMPNVNPATLNKHWSLREKVWLLQHRAHWLTTPLPRCNRGHQDQIKKLGPDQTLWCGNSFIVSTGNLLVEDPQALDAIFVTLPSWLSPTASGPGGSLKTKSN